MEALGVFTNRGLDRLLAEGGTQAWVLNPKRARKLTYVVCAQNRNDGDWGQPSHQQGQGFLIGRISSVEPSAEPDRSNRYMVRFSEYAEIDVPGMAKQWRNPVRYVDLEKYDIDPTKLKFLPLVKGDRTSPRGHPTAGEGRALDMSGAKKALAAFYSVPVSSIEIMIRG